MTEAQINLSVELAGLTLQNPITTASGTFAPGKLFAELWVEQGLAERNDPFGCLGAVTTKGVSNVPWPGNDGIRIDETASGMLNSIGLENPGVEAFCADDLVWLAGCNRPIIVNVCGHSASDYVAVIERLESEPAVSAYEINISCPNADNSGMAFGIDPVIANQVIAACRNATKRPMIVKLSPNVTDITEIARAVCDAGADALSMINTLAGMTIDLPRRRPVFDRVLAGLSGPAIKPIALWAIYRVYQIVDIPIIGMGGVRSATDIVEFMLAGATVVAIGSHNFTDPLALPKAQNELYQWCEANEVSDIRSLIGALHA